MISRQNELRLFLHVALICYRLSGGELCLFSRVSHFVGPVTLPLEEIDRQTYSFGITRG